ncbi:MAG: cupin domain-containing protein [Bacillota bacterium]
MNVVKSGGTAWTDLGGGVRRRALAYTKDGMAVEVRFEKGGAGPQHSHPHAQCTYVQSGKFVFTAGGRDYEVSAGDTLAFERNETHGCVCKAAGTLIDVFSPMRDDFI